MHLLPDKHKNLLKCTIHTSIQLTALGIISEPLLGIPATWSILMGGLITIIYTAIGGIKSVAITRYSPVLHIYGCCSAYCVSCGISRRGYRSIIFKSTFRKVFDSRA
ncbi:sodium:solute symporter family transporter [Cardinium endosymbiont of Nabis limbatus]|uniref:sodium:solute symporter family transporter n=1 Tax=Cardinium endosymbiont of Nabis limbatus TaxID=3066217 RepID=UPI003AF3C0A8